MSDEEKIVTHLTVNNQTRAIADSDSRSKIVNILLQLEGKIESGLKTLIKEEETARKSADAAINNIIGSGFKDSNGKVTSTLTEKITTLDGQMAGNKDSGLLTKINTLVDRVGDGFKDSSGKVVSLTTKISNLLNNGVKNPNALSFTGGSNVKYDGSEAKSVSIPTSLKNPYPLVINNNGGSSQNGQVTYDGSHSNHGDGSTVITMPTSLENPQSLIFTGGSSVEYDGSEEKTVAIPTSLPASDVSAWAKAATKPSYSCTEIGAAQANHTHSVNDITDFTSGDGFTMTDGKVSFAGSAWVVRNGTLQNNRQTGLSWDGNKHEAVDTWRYQLWSNGYFTATCEHLFYINKNTHAESTLTLPFLAKDRTSYAIIFSLVKNNTFDDFNQIQSILAARSDIEDNNGKRTASSFTVRAYNNSNNDHYYWQYMFIQGYYDTTQDLSGVPQDE